MASRSGYAPTYRERVPLPFDAAGTGSPVVLLHAGVADRRMWAAQIPVLAERYQVSVPVIGRATLDGRQCGLAVMDFSFMGGSMGSVVGEKFSRACDSAAEAGMPLVSVTSSGGARMQEGILALMQLPKTVAAVEDLHDSGQALLCVMAHPTTGGVLASFATLGDVVLAEPNALMSFAGPRVVQEITREKLPEDFGRAEQNLRYGQIDAIVPRPELRPTLARLLRLFNAAD